MVGIVPDRGAQSGEARRDNALARGKACAVDQSLRGHRVDTGGAAFSGQVETRPLRIAGVPCRGLQQAQPDFYPVVRGQTLGDKRRQQQIRLSELLNDLVFHVRDALFQLDQSMSE